MRVEDRLKSAPGQNERCKWMIAEDRIWQYAVAIGNQQKVTEIAPQDRQLVPAIIEVLEERGLFKCLRADDGVAAAMRAFAATDPVLTNPLGQTRKAGIAFAANCPDTPQGCFDTIAQVDAKVPYELVFLVEATRVPDQLVQLFTSSANRGRLVILK